MLDWAGWEIDGMLQPYVDKHGQKPSYYGEHPIVDVSYPAAAAY